MNSLLDECVPWPLHRSLPGHTFTTAQREGWGGITNGDLLRRAEGKFDLFITCDRNLRYQQNLEGRTLPTLELETNDLRRLVAAAAVIAAEMDRMRPGAFMTLAIP
jgi:hypothetical protein